MRTLRDMNMSKFVAEVCWVGGGLWGWGWGATTVLHAALFSGCLLSALAPLYAG